MQYGVTLPFDEPANVIVDLACEAEAAGWDGVFVWDGISDNDPWVVLGAIAARTTRVRLGTMLTPVSRRRPWKLAQETATLDRLSGGRAILPVGLGSAESNHFAVFGEEMDRRTRAEMLDEGLDILDGLWSGQPFAYEGTHFQVREFTFVPTPVQRPRVPIWVVGAWPRMKSMRRVLRWDGLLIHEMVEGDRPTTPDAVRAMCTWIAEHRTATTAFDVIWEGVTPGDDPAKAASIVREWQEAGVTWWLESVWEGPRTQAGVDGMRTRIQQGPPRSLR